MKKDLKYPILSIAQSRLKRLEYLAIGPAIVFSFEKILREELKDSLQGKNALVLGYGNVGRAVAWALRSAQASVMVLDADPFRMIEARLEGFCVGPKGELMGVANVVFGTTGQQSLGREDLKLLRSGAYLVSGSSRQIEFDITALSTMGVKERIANSLTRFRVEDKEIILVNDGFPVNFRDPPFPWPWLT